MRIEILIANTCNIAPKKANNQWCEKHQKKNNVIILIENTAGTIDFLALLTAFYSYGMCRI